MAAGLTLLVLGVRIALRRDNPSLERPSGTGAGGGTGPLRGPGAGGDRMESPSSRVLGRESLKQRRALLLVFVVFGLLAFSGDILDASQAPSPDEEPPWWHVVVADVVLLAIVGLFGHRTRWHSGAPLDHEAGRGFFVAGAVLMLVLDVFWVEALDRADVQKGWEILLSVVWVVPLALLACYVLAVNPLKLPAALRRAEESSRRDADALRGELLRARDKLVSTLPLLVGVAATYVAQGLYFEELPRIDGIPRIDREYFTQMSEIIPVLLVALAIDASFLSAEAKVSTTRWAISVYAVALLVAAEALAISALPVDNQREGEQLYDLHQYLAFSLTIYACFVALAALVMMNATGLGRRWVATS